MSGMPKKRTTRLSPPPLDLTGPTSDLFAKIRSCKVLSTPSSSANSDFEKAQFLNSASSFFSMLLLPHIQILFSLYTRFGCEATGDESTVKKLEKAEFKN